MKKKKTVTAIQQWDASKT